MSVVEAVWQPESVEKIEAVEVVDTPAEEIKVENGETPAAAAKYV